MLLLLLPVVGLDFSGVSGLGEGEEGDQEDGADEGGCYLVYDPPVVVYGDEAVAG